MKFNNLFKTITILLLVAFALPIAATASVTSKPLPDSAADARLYTSIVTRVAEIQRMDIANLSAAEKKGLKKELKEMKDSAEKRNRGVYLSFGAIIIIILLLILLI